MSECIPTVMPKLAAAPQAASEVARMRPRGYCCMNLLLPVGESVESLDVYAPDAMASVKETAGGSSKVGSDICVVPDMLQTAVSVTTVVTEKWMERFVLDLDDLRLDVLARTFGPAVSEEYSPVVFAGGGGAVAEAYPLVVVESDTTRVSDLPMEGRLGCGRSGRWPTVSLSGFGGYLADFDRRASPVG